MFCIFLCYAVVKNLHVQHLQELVKFLLNIIHLLYYTLIHVLATQWGTTDTSYVKYIISARICFVKQITSS